jgi:hypothetical protein
MNRDAGDEEDGREESLFLSPVSSSSLFIQSEIPVVYISSDIIASCPINLSGFDGFSALR